jgi:hypothetical protein
LRNSRNSAGWWYRGRRKEGGGRTGIGIGMTGRLGKEEGLGNVGNRRRIMTGMSSEFYYILSFR